MVHIIMTLTAHNPLFALASRSQEFRSFIETCLKKEPSERPKTAALLNVSLHCADVSCYSRQSLDVLPSSAARPRDNRQDSSENKERRGQNRAAGKHQPRAGEGRRYDQPGRCTVRIIMLIDFLPFTLLYLLWCAQ